MFFIIIPAAIYYMSYYPYGRASGMHGVGMYFTSDYASLVLDNQKFMFSYHSGVLALVAVGDRRAADTVLPQVF